MRQLIKLAEMVVLLVVVFMVMVEELEVVIHSQVQ